MKDRLWWARLVKDEFGADALQMLIEGRGVVELNGFSALEAWEEIKNKLGARLTRPLKSLTPKRPRRVLTFKRDAHLEDVPFTRKECNALDSVYYQPSKD